MTKPTRRPTNRDTYTPAPYVGDGLECIATVSPATNTSEVLAAVAAWHEAPWRRKSRHHIIAAALRRAAGVPAANDNRPPRRRAA